MSTSSTNIRSTGRNFIRVTLHSGTSANPMGDEELAIFCQCNNEDPSENDVDIPRLIKWVNGNPAFKRNQSRNLFRISDEEDAKTAVYLTMPAIRSCQAADRIFPRLRPATTTEK